MAMVRFWRWRDIVELTFCPSPHSLLFDQCVSVFMVVNQNNPEHFTMADTIPETTADISPQSDFLSNIDILKCVIGKKRHRQGQPVGCHFFCASLMSILPVIPTWFRLFPLGFSIIGLIDSISPCSILMGDVRLGDIFVLSATKFVQVNHLCPCWTERYHRRWNIPESSSLQHW